MKLINGLPEIIDVVVCHEDTIDTYYGNLTDCGLTRAIKRVVGSDKEIICGSATVSVGANDYDIKGSFYYSDFAELANDKNLLIKKRLSYSGPAKQ